MDILAAHEILGTTPGQSLSDIKKAYREIIKKVHPDEIGNNISGFNFSAMDVNIAYETVLKNINFKLDSNANNRDKSYWKAAENSNAYCQREIFHNAEDSEGNVIGVISIGFGKYVWCEDEEFSLFMKSVMSCSKEILDDIDRGMKREINENDRIIYRAELTYLLTTQFIDSRDILSKYASLHIKNNETHYKLSAMLEYDSNLSYQEINNLKSGISQIIPDCLSNHRLFLKNEKGKAIGYMSLPDDRLYYAVIPLFEQRVVQMKAAVDNNNTYSLNRKNKIRGKYIPFELTLRFVADVNVFAIESINMNIEELIENYKKDFS